MSTTSTQLLTYLGFALTLTSLLPGCGDKETEDDTGTDTEPPSYALDITAPEGGQTWYLEETYQITWSSTGLPSDDDVCVRICEGMDHTGSGSADSCVEVECFGSNDGLIEGVVIEPAMFVESDHYYVTINDQEELAWDISDYFSIESEGSDEPALEISAPAGGESWYLDKTYEITWSSIGLPNDDDVCVRICEGSAHTGSGSTDTCVEVECFGPNDGVIEGVVVEPSTFAESELYYITINDYDGLASDIGDYFNIESEGSPEPALEITAPAGGETWYLDDTYEITWSSIDLPSGDDICVRICEGTEHTGAGGADTCVSVECFGTNDGVISSVTMDSSTFTASEHYYITINDFDGLAWDIGGYFTVSPIP